MRCTRYASNLAFAGSVRPCTSGSEWAGARARKRDSCVKSVGDAEAVVHSRTANEPRKLAVDVFQRGLRQVRVALVRAVDVDDDQDPRAGAHNDEGKGRTVGNLELQISYEKGENGIQSGCRRHTGWPFWESSSSQCQ